MLLGVVQVPYLAIHSICIYIYRTVIHHRTATTVLYLDRINFLTRARDCTSDVPGVWREIETDRTAQEADATHRSSKRAPKERATASARRRSSRSGNVMHTRVHAAVHWCGMVRTAFTQLSMSALRNMLSCTGSSSRVCGCPPKADVCNCRSIT